MTAKDNRDEVFFYHWFDCPAYGIANLNGQPHFFEFQGYQPTPNPNYLLSPVSQDILQMAKESWDISKRWETAHRQGKVHANTHPYLDEDRQRGSELDAKLREAFVLDKENAIEKAATFSLKTPQQGSESSKDLMVQWTTPAPQNTP
ncbi:MAG: hypothetical protein AAFV95_01850 [Bacteroidota bacterium]